MSARPAGRLSLPSSTAETMPARPKQPAANKAAPRINHNDFRNGVEAIISTYKSLGANKSHDLAGTLKALKGFAEGVFEKARGGSKIHQTAFDEIFPKHVDWEPIPGGYTVRSWSEIANTRDPQRAHDLRQQTLGIAIMWISNQLVGTNVNTSERQAETPPDRRHLRDRPLFRGLTVHL